MTKFYLVDLYSLVIFQKVAFSYGISLPSWRVQGFRQLRHNACYEFFFVFIQAYQYLVEHLLTQLTLLMLVLSTGLDLVIEYFFLCLVVESSFWLLNFNHFMKLMQSVFRHRFYLNFMLLREVTCNLLRRLANLSQKVEIYRSFLHYSTCLPRFARPSLV